RRNFDSFNFAALAYVEVLAVMAQPIAPCCRDRKYFCAWHVMCHRFFLNRINVSGDDFPIYEEFQFSCFVASNATESDLTFWNVAVSCTGCASYSAAR